MEKEEKWIPFIDPKLGKNKKLPPEKKYVLLHLEHVDKSKFESGGICVGWLKYAAGDKTCPFFVHPAMDSFVRVIAWSDQIPNFKTWPKND